MDALIGTFHIDWKSMVAQIINFSVVFFVLYRFALKPLMKAMDERNQIIKQGVDDAAKHAQLLQDAQNIHEKELSNARAEAHDLITEIKKSAEDKRQEMLASAEKEVSILIEDGKQSIELEKTKMIGFLKKEIGQLVVNATEKIVGTEIDKNISSQILEKSITELRQK